MPRIFAYIIHRDGVLDDSALELATAARRIDKDAKPTAIVVGSEADIDKLEKLEPSLGAAYGEVWKIAGDALAYPNAEIVRKALLSILPAGSILLLPHDTFGMDLAPGLAVKTDYVYAADIVDIEGLAGTSLDLIRQEYGGQVSVRIQCEIAAGAILTIRPGAFQPEVQPAGEQAVVINKTAEIGEIATKRRYLDSIAPEAGEVDITKADILVSVGRGIQDAENIEIAQQLAGAIGGVVSCSRPVADAKWLEISRSVGTSGQTVKPKVYLACGISGSFQHLGGIKGNPFIVAINKNPKAPIFRVANVGIVADILEFLPEMTSRIGELRQ